MKIARDGKTTREMEIVAKNEQVDLEFIRRGIETGRIIVPKSNRRELDPPLGIGKGLLVKINANIGSSKTVCDIEEEVEKAMEDAKQFILKNNIATIHSDDKLVVEDTPAFLAPLIPFAAMMMPSRFDKPMIGVYIVTRPKDMANMGKHLNYASVLNTAVHEAFPGHFLQGTISNRGSLIHLFAGGTETTEGWAHYCEQMMMEHGFVKGLEAKLTQINDVIWRAVRIIVDVRLSRGEMSFDEAVNMLVKETGMSKEGATAEVRRYTMTPGYQLSYLLGKHLILKLRDEIKQQLGEKFNEKFKKIIKPSNLVKSIVSLFLGLVGDRI